MSEALVRLSVAIADLVAWVVLSTVVVGELDDSFATSGCRGILPLGCRMRGSIGRTWRLGS
jgi:hypothetical protein